MKLRKAKAKLARRIRGYEKTMASDAGRKLPRGYHKPGSMK